MSQLTVEAGVRTGVVGDPARPSLAHVLTLGRSADGALYVACAECGHRYGAASRDPKLRAVMTETSIVTIEAQTAAAPAVADGLVARRYYCPSCALLFAVDVQRRGDPLTPDWTADSLVPDVSALFAPAAA